MTFEFLALQRPQYPSSPEVLLSALAWSVVPRESGKKNVGLIYERLSSSGKKGRATQVTIEQTKPRGDALTAFCEELRAQGFADLQGELTVEVGMAVANSMMGVRPTKGVGYASSAVGIAGALLQDSVGGLGTKNPPNFAHLVNTLYSLGGKTEGSTAAEQWFTAARYHATNGRLQRIEASYARNVLIPYLDPFVTWPPTQPVLEDGAKPSAAPGWWVDGVVSPGVATPFSWFRCSWDRLCSPEWHEKLAPRRWAAWAVCVLRQGLAFAFLWEANFFHELAKGVLDAERDPATVARWAVVPVRPLVPYQRGNTSQMDVMPGIKRMLSIGLACRKAIQKIVSETGMEASTLTELVQNLRAQATDGHRSTLRAALTGSGDTGGLPNLLETVRYSLLARGGGEEVDNYGLLKVVSRNYTHVSPGPEWIVVMSAMASMGPNSPLRLGDVMQSIKALGFQPRIDFLLAELERAGLCASAADGDEGIGINLGFGRG